MGHSQINNPPISINVRNQRPRDGKMEAIIEMSSHQDAIKTVQNVTMTKLEGTMCFVDLMSVRQKRKKSTKKSASKRKLRKESFSGGEKMKGTKARLKKKVIEGKGKKKGGLKK